MARGKHTLPGERFIDGFTNPTSAYAALPEIADRMQMMIRELPPDAGEYARQWLVGVVQKAPATWQVVAVPKHPGVPDPPELTGSILVANLGS